jgi:hypothetical protein
MIPVGNKYDINHFGVQNRIKSYSELGTKQLEAGYNFEMNTCDSILL